VGTPPQQSTISADSRYLMVNLPTGLSPDRPINNILTVDLVAKEVVRKVVVNYNGGVGGDDDVSILTPLACYQ
jgi:hypothetical protein